MKCAVVFYSWSGRTREMAHAIAEQTGADLVEIEAETPYSQDYDTVVDQAKREIQTGTPRPFKPIGVDLAHYDTVFLGSPVWWGTMAPPLATFVRSVDWNGKTIMPFSTHGGGGKGRTDSDMKKACSGAAFKDMYTAYEGGGTSGGKDIAAWIIRNLQEKGTA
ncbi:MAG: NAD(P)H-dependent oxidoreductase [Planctomycetaceae bacterium]|nr:NAD(P)H-dependent oxidoreductase [Planctomycetaceae bacterium]